MNVSRSFHDALVEATGAPLTPAAIETVQVNVGLACNLACLHCHVESGPKRTEAMSRETMAQVLDVARAAGARVVDITGGAPEMHPHFRWFVDEAIRIGARVMVRTNLTILLEEGYVDLPAWFATRRVHLVASLPCYTAANVDAQRGRGTFDGSIAALRALNAVGYGVRQDLPLDLVYNPGGTGLPGPQAALEADYRRRLAEDWGLAFTRLLTITNMPIGRFARDLAREDRLEPYVARLADAFNPATVEGLMCRHQLHVAWDGQLYDCDFNYALGMGVVGVPPHIGDVTPETFLQRRIATAAHCFGCTAGAGSSCGGALA
ncbi:radical SAM/Cys-rich domain protein [Luteitalea sp. TBR-22]|uniref:arsenosugar biosynthesis radical SAM (seleno)protein ArsS n=1 Tax=Luteitalea sp. TBR-22 TaxID=2802971 RepID=UPI001AF8388E|nr:arsenosugar biosynthesis radical SAM (seleno)protein ArsS [Luteitalea sp. TBR-22]BCS31131.1 radical SAM/Cys-rich domain protein [Luteitalea sp. TBR-22]